MSRTLLRAGLALGGVVLAAAGALHAGPAPHAAPYQVVGLRAHLFYSDRGALSDDLLGRADLVLWNTPVGEGGAGGPSRSTLVVVEVAGEPESYEAGRRVELTVQAPKGTPLRRQQPLGALNKAGRTYVAFWLDDTGCEHLRVTAALRGQPEPSHRAAELPFRCGE